MIGNALILNFDKVKELYAENKAMNEYVENL